MAARCQNAPNPPAIPIQVYFREALLIGGEATRLYLVRHAQSQGNTGEDLTTGDADLTEVGREQARRLGRAPQDASASTASTPAPCDAPSRRPPRSRTPAASKCCLRPT